MSIYSYVDYIEAGYRSLDKYCSDVISLLKKYGRLENTVIVVYGDHGDDFWTHGMHAGLTHATEPIEQLIHTPMFIWDGNHYDNVVRQEIVQTIDLFDVVKRIVEDEISAENVEIRNREYAFARSEYAAQPVREESFNKGYSVTDGKYILIVTGSGLEMYNTVLDPMCVMNYLEFFIFNDDVLILDSEKVKPFYYHFAIFFSSRQQRIIRDEFYKLHSALIKEMQDIYKSGGCEEEQMYAEMKLFEIKYNKG